MLQIVRRTYRAELEQIDQKGLLSIFSTNSQGNSHQTPASVLTHNYAILESAFISRPRPGSSLSSVIKRINEMYYSKTGEGKFEKNLAYLLLREEPFQGRFPSRSFVPLSSEELEKMTRTFYRGNAVRVPAKDEELVLFKSLSYYKFQLNTAAKNILNSPPSRCDFQKISKLIDSYKILKSIKETICSINIPLIQAMTRNRSFPDLEESLDEGLFYFFNTANKFDFTRKIKFSTYACSAIKRGLNRGYQRTLKHIHLSLDEYDESAPIQEDIDKTRREETELQLNLLNKVLDENLANLSAKELEIVRTRFGFFDGPLTLKETGFCFGISKERVRQIQIRAIKKLGQAFHAEYARRYESPIPQNSPAATY